MHQHAASVALALFHVSSPPRTSVLPAAADVATSDVIVETKQPIATTAALRTTDASAAEIANTVGESPVVTFDVGGRLFRTRLATIVVPTHGRLARLARDATERLVRGATAPPIFIDRSPRHFEHILDHLRGVDVRLADLSASDVRRLLDEATYYGLPGLAVALAPAPVEADIRARQDRAKSVLRDLASTIPLPYVDVIIEHEDAIHAWVEARARAIAPTRVPDATRPTVDEIDRASPFLAILAQMICNQANVYASIAAATSPESPTHFRGTPPPPPSPLIATAAPVPSDALMHVNLEPR